MLAETELTYTGAAESFEWSGHGFRLHFPEHLLPRDLSACVLNVKAAISGQFELPKGTELVSGVYCISSPCKFTSGVTVDIQHCLKATAGRDVSRLSFVIADCSQPGLPYCFKPLDGGVFTGHSSYGSVELSHFSLLAIVYWLVGFRPASEGSSSESESDSSAPESLSSMPQVNYCSQLYYRQPHLKTYKVNFVITRNLELHIRVYTCIINYCTTYPVHINNIAKIKAVKFYWCFEYVCRLLLTETLRTSLVLARRWILKKKRSN